MKHKGPDYKLSTVKYYLNNKYGYDKTCKYLIVINLQSNDGYIHITLQTLLPEIIENLYHII